MIFFNVSEARQQLLSRGIVYTLRPRMRRVGTDLAVYGSYFEQKRIGNVSVSFIKQVNHIDELREYLFASGFKTSEDWWKAAKGSRFLFRVALLEPVKGESQRGFTKE